MPQATVTTHGNADNFLLGEAGASNSYNTTANYSFNPSPDIIAKIAFDPGFGHYEIFGLADRFTDRVFPCGEVLSTSHLRRPGRWRHLGSRSLQCLERRRRPRRQRALQYRQARHYRC